MMKRFGSILAALGLAMAIAGPAAADTEIVISGSTTVLPVMQQAGEAFMAVNPEINLSISGGGSGNGINALIEGLCQIAMSSREIKPSELENAAANGVNPVRHTIAIDALVPVVHPQNPVSNLSIEQLKDIYAGRIRNWQEVGGNDERIVVISRDSSSGTFETWESMIMDGDRVAPSALLQASNGAVVQTVANNRRAIGYIGFGYLNDSLKKLDVDGLQATPETALAGLWPIARELYLYTNGPAEGPADAPIRALIDYLIDPDRGQKDVAAVGYIPLSEE